MVEIAQFTDAAQRREPDRAIVDTGVSEMWDKIASFGSSLAARLGAMADAAAQKEGELAGAQAGLAAAVPAAPQFMPGGSATAAGGTVSGSQGEPDDYYARLRQIESGNDNGAVNPATGAAGPYQFLPETAARYGLANPHDPAAALAAAKSFTEDNRAYLAQKLGRQPTNAELYLAHQQGAGGAVKLLANPGMRAIDLLGRKAVRLNGGTDSMSAAQFAGLWTDKFDNTTPGGSVAAPAAYTASPSKLMVPDQPEGPSLALTRSWTIRGEAYDKMALQTYVDRMDVSVREGLANIAKQYPDDPQKMAGAMHDWEQGAISQAPPEIQPAIAATAARQRVSYISDATDKMLANQRDERVAAFNDRYTAMRDDIMRLASTAGVNPKADKALAAELQDFEGFLNNAQDLKATEREKLHASMFDEVTAARVTGTFNKMTSPEQRATFAAAFAKGYEDGTTKLSPEAYDRVTGAMNSTLTKDATARETQARVIGKSVDDAISQVRHGYSITPEQLTTLQSQVDILGDPTVQRAYQTFKTMASWQMRERTSPPARINAQIAALQSDMNKNGAAPEQIAMLDTMTGLRDTIVKGIKDDPLTLAETTGRAAVTPVDVTSADAFTSSMKQRAAEAGAVAQAYGIEPKYFKPDEIQALQQSFTDKPELLLGFAKSLEDALGADAPRALAQISGQAPLIAHAAGVSLATGDDTLVREISRALKLSKVDGYEPLKLPAAQRDPIMANTNTALRFLPDLQAVAGKAADVLFDSVGKAQGLDPKNDTAASQTAYGDAVDKALGGHVVDGAKQGGLGKVNGITTLLPPDMSEDQVQHRLDNLTDEQLRFMGPIGTPNGIPINAARIAQGFLVAAGHGVYRVALSNPAGPDPRFIARPDGSYWSIDMKALQWLQGRLPGEPPRTQGHGL